MKYYCHFRGCYKTTISQPGLDAYVQEVALAWFEQPANLGQNAFEPERVLIAPRVG